MNGHADRVALPALLFGNDRAHLHTDAKAFGDAVNAMFPGLNAYEPLPQANGVFRSKSVQVQLDGIGLMSSSMSPTYVDRSNSQVLTLLLPIAGEPRSTASVGREHVRWGVHEGAVLLPVTDERVTGTGGFRNQLMLNLDARQLQSIAHSMIGHDLPAPDLMLDRARPLPLLFGNKNLIKGIMQTMPLIQAYLEQPQLLNTLGISDLLLRQVIILLRPDLFLLDENPQTESGQSQMVKKLCEYMVAHLSEPITLSTLESVAGISGRMLQYTFKRALGCSPMQWLRDQRLRTAQQLLLQRADLTVSQVAARCGYVSASLFAASYRKKFGQSPSEGR